MNSSRESGSRPAPDATRSKRTPPSMLLLLLPFALLAMACGNNGGKKDEGIATTAGIQTNPVFVAAGSTTAANTTRQLRISIGSPLPVADAGAPDRGLTLGPNAVRP